MAWTKIERGAKPAVDDIPQLRISKSQISINLVGLAAIGNPTHIDIFVDDDKIMIVAGDDFKISPNGGQSGRKAGKNWGKRKTFKSSRLEEAANGRIGECKFIREEALPKTDERVKFGLVFEMPTAK